MPCIRQARLKYTKPSLLNQPYLHSHHHHRHHSWPIAPQPLLSSSPLLFWGFSLSLRIHNRVKLSFLFFTPYCLCFDHAAPVITPHPSMDRVGCWLPFCLTMRIDEGLLLTLLCHPTDCPRNPPVLLLNQQVLNAPIIIIVIKSIIITSTHPSPLPCAKIISTPTLEPHPIVNALLAYSALSTKSKTMQPSSLFVVSPSRCLFSGSHFWRIAHCFLTVLPVLFPV